MAKTMTGLTPDAEPPRASIAYPRPRLGALVGGAIVIALLYFGRDVLAPCALAVLLAFLLDPLVTRLRRIGLARGHAVALALSLTVTGLSAASYFVVRQVTVLGKDLPAYQSTIQGKLRGMTRMTAESPVVGDASRVIDAVSAELESARREAKAATSRGPSVKPQPVVLDESPEKAWEEMKARVLAAVGFLTTAGIVLLILVLVLLQRNDLRDRLIRLAGNDLHLTTDAMDEIAQRVGRYLGTQLLINVLYGVPMAVGLLAIGVPGALMWGLLAALLRFVPYVGPVIAAMFPLVLSAAVDPGWSMLLWTALLVVTLELVSNQVVEPWLYGASTGLSALSIVVSAIFWTALWGPIGLVLSTPMTVCLAVIGRHVPHLAWLDVLLGNAPPIDDATRLHQRLLAGDVEEAIELASRSIAASSVMDYYSDAGVPALRQAVLSYDSAASFEHRHRVSSGMATLLGTLREEYPGVVDGGDCRVLCLGVRWEVDALAADMLAHALAVAGIPAQVVANAATADEAGLPEIGEADTVCLSVFSPSPEAKVRFVARRLKRRHPGLRVLVAAWNPPASLADPEAAATLEVEGIAVTLREAVHQLSAWQRTGHAPAPQYPSTTTGTLAAGANATAADRTSELRGILTRSAQHAAEVFAVPLATVTLTGLGLRVAYDRSRATAPDPGPGVPPWPDEPSTALVAEKRALSWEDLARDARFADATTGPDGGLRFLAGTPLELANESVVGTLCLFDRAQRPLGRDEIRLLAKIGRDTSASLEPALAGARSEAPAGAGSATAAGELDPVVG